VCLELQQHIVSKILGEIGCDYMDWIDMAYDRDQLRTVVNSVINVQIPYSTGKFLSSCTTVSVSN
jgi:hypothetical protein